MYLRALKKYLSPSLYLLLGFPHESYHLDPRVSEDNVIIECIIKVIYFV